MSWLPEELNEYVLGGLVLFCLASLRLIAVVNRRLRPDGVIPRMLQWVRRGLRVVFAVFALWLAVALTPEWLEPAVPWLLGGGAVVFVVAARNVLVDLFAGAVLVFERRVRPGQYVRGDGFAGVVERLHLRRTTIRDESDRHVDVPNRHLLDIRVDGDDGPWLTHEARVVIDDRYKPDDVRIALEKAVLCTPWTPLEPHAAVRRDGDRWIVRARLLDVRYIAPFEAAIVRSAEAILCLAEAPITR